MKTIDLKSLVLGAVLGGTVLVLMGADLPQRPSTSLGRYQVSAGANRAYVIDTTTGQVWESVVLPNSVNPDPDFARPKTK